MPMRVLALAATTLLATISAALATPFSGSYTAVPAGNAAYLPTVNDDGGAFLSSPFSGSLAAGVTTAPITFLQVAPVSAASTVGTQLGAIDIGMTITDPSGAAIVGATASAGGNGVQVIDGTLYFNANYAFNYSSQTDCLIWNAASCSPSSTTKTIGETLAATFADGTVLDINLYNWSDWDLAPDISFELLNGPTPVSEPASFAIFASAVLALFMMRRRRAARPARASLQRNAPNT